MTLPLRYDDVRDANERPPPSDFTGNLINQELHKKEKKNTHTGNSDDNNKIIKNGAKQKKNIINTYTHKKEREKSLY